MGHLSLPEIRLQIAAITLAEELNFTRTAERLRITQPALSKQIAELEDRIGFSVFTREQKRVELTQAGEVFVRGCKDAHAILEKAVQLQRSNVAVRPLSHESLRVTTYLALRADQSARLVNEFGRAFLRKVQPKGKPSGAADQMQLGLCWAPSSPGPNITEAVETNQ
jgi:DNA-binding transcriptional LysR family regulator